MGCFKRKSPHEFDEKNPVQDGPEDGKKSLSEPETEGLLGAPPEAQPLLDGTKGDVPDPDPEKAESEGLTDVQEIETAAWTTKFESKIGRRWSRWSAVSASSVWIYCCE